MNRLLRPFLTVACLLGGAAALLAQPLSLPLEIRQNDTPFNFQARRGVPISTVSNVPPGSDGRMTTVNQSGSGILPTTNQFRGFISFGGISGWTNGGWQVASNSTLLRGTNGFSGVVALAMGLPVGISNNAAGGPVALILRRGQIGAPYLSRQVSFAFGSVVAAPGTDENGLLLTNILSTDYWLPEPYTTTGHTNSGYYWSPHAGKVYAIQAGPLQITWKKAAYVSSLPSDYTNALTGATNYVINAGNYFRLYTASYVVSGSPVKPSRKFYWTEKGFQNLGKPVTVPAARVGAVVFAYNNNFPRTVATPYVGPGDSSPTDGSTNAVLQELRTLWYDQQQGAILAYNQEGRVFLELLGDLRPDGVTRVPLGTEIVDVVKNPSPSDVTIELGEQLKPPAPGTLDTLTPEPILQLGAPTFAFQHYSAGSSLLKLYATRATANLNDYLVHWLEEGEVGLKWPKFMGRYSLVWPAEVAKYSHYVRPLAATEAEAKATAVQLPTANVPALEYQDPLDQVRGKLTETYAYYTWLDADHPLHRGLLRFSTGAEVAFERVFSWLDVNLKSANYVNNAIATNLLAWNPTNGTLQFPDPLTAPRVVNQTVEVGQRLNAPADEPGGTSNYLAGHLNPSAGTLFNPNAYLDPLASGFPAANLGAIIPVNAIPGANTLEVWWFRTNAATAGAHAANAGLGFLPVFWPSVLGHYTIQWPASPREIVLASTLGSAGSGPLNSFEAVGTIYSQNDPALPGYNPNEEHAILSGGAAYATRDDLNITNGAGYSSHPFVLVEYQAADGRPAMTPFKVLREKPEAGWVFDYIVPAGQLLQAPMPLPLLAKPVEGSGDNATNYNTEPARGTGDLPGGWTQTNDFIFTFFGFQFRIPGLWTVTTGASGVYSNYANFTYKDRKNDLWVYRGLHAGLPALQAGRYDGATQTFAPITSATGIVGIPFAVSVHASRQDEFLALSAPDAPAWLTINGLTLSGTPTTSNVGTNTIQVIVRDLYDQSSFTNSVVLQVRTSGAVIGQAPLVMLSTNSFTGSMVGFSNRPPFLARSPNPSNSFTMRYYYKTEPSFAWPGLANPPAAGSIVPYLRPLDGSGAFVGDPTDKNAAALDIVYRPVWPERDPKDSTKPLPTLPYGLTLVKPQLGLPGVGDWKTARVLYQQSIAANLTDANASVVLHDPTRQKTAAIADFGMQALPASVRAQSYQGKTFFPNLPPHLATRLFFDPARGAKGSLVLAGEFKNEIVGESYLFLNVLRGSDLASAMNLCPPGDTVNYPKWTNAIAALATGLETFYENPAVPGSYIVNTNLTVSVGVGDLAEVTSDNVAVDSYALSATGPGGGYVTLVEAGGNGKFTQPGDPVALHVFKIGGALHRGEVKVIPAANPLSELVTFQHTPDLAGRFTEYEYEWKIAAPADGLPPLTDATMSRYLALTSGANLPRYVLGGSGIQVLGDNYVVLRYRPVNPDHPLYNQWSAWTTPQLAEGWIKRVLGGINPFNQRVNDLFNNAAVTTGSILTSAGHRWEGDVALNLDSINNFGLIEIYETVLRRGRSISIESGYNYGPANDALLLAAGYLNDLYMMEGNEAWADAANPTIGIGTANNTYGNIATALFAFKGEVASLLEEELALLRGRDDFLQPGVAIAPVYNRLVWNYTRGIDAGEVIYALNYNITDQNADGVVNATDAAILYPQGHGDAYGHYLTALKGYYSLLLNNNFDWVPRIEAVTVLGVPVSVDYQDERKFAAAAAALGRAGRQAFDLTWRKDYQPGHDSGWAQFSATRVNSQRTFTNQVAAAIHPVRYWGLDHWATRTGQGDYLNWVVGSAILPAVDPDPTHEGIQKIDRTTVPELAELAALGSDLQTALDNAEGGLTPLGLPQGSVALDINPNVVVGSDNGTHFEQIYGRAKVALNNAVAAFDDAKDVTRLMRSEQDSLVGVQAAAAQQELAYNNALIELYGTPYSDDIGPGKTWKQGYTGPDLIHYTYIEIPESDFGGNWDSSGTFITNRIDIQQLPDYWTKGTPATDFNFYVPPSDPSYSNGTHYVEFVINPHNFNQKPPTWTGRRVSPGQIQQAISGVVRAHATLVQALDDAQGDSIAFARDVALFKSTVQTAQDIRKLQRDMLIAEQVVQSAEFANEEFGVFNEFLDTLEAKITEGSIDALPKSLIAGVAAGGDLTSAGRATIKLTEAASFSVRQTIKLAADAVVKALAFATTTANQWVEFKQIGALEISQELRTQVEELGKGLENVQSHYGPINASLRALDDAQRNLDGLIAKGDRIQQEREVARQRTAALVQGYRTRDAGFRIFRNEKLERYKTLFDLSARYAFLAANAYDYETGLLDTTAGRAFVSQIISTRALGVVRNGEPQFAGSDTGDPGLSSALAQMKADWDVLKGRLGFNNPDAYGTTVSLRRESLRLLPGTEGDGDWKDALQRARTSDLLQDPDVRRYCLQIDSGDGLPVPGLIVTFTTTIANGYNLFGQPLAAGDHAFSPSSFATKIFGAGVDFEGYIGMANPPANGGAGGTSPPDPTLDPNGLAATPYVYLIPVGLDSMRTPPLGDTSAIRTFTVEDVAIPLPFNIGASQFASGGLYLSADTLTEPLFVNRKHQAFRPVSDATLFSMNLYTSGGGLQRSQFTNNRLIGRSVWNSQWKLIIPGRTLLNDSNQGLERFIQSVTDIKLHFVTYSYSGN